MPWAHAGECCGTTSSRLLHWQVVGHTYFYHGGTNCQLANSRTQENQVLLANLTVRVNLLSAMHVALDRGMSECPVSEAPKQQQQQP